MKKQNGRRCIRVAKWEGIPGRGRERSGFTGIQPDVPDTIHPGWESGCVHVGKYLKGIYVWEDRKVEFFGEIWKTVGFSQQGIENMIPLDWNRKVQVERYE